MGGSWPRTQSNRSLSGSKCASSRRLFTAKKSVSSPKQSAFGHSGSIYGDTTKASKQYDLSPERSPEGILPPPVKVLQRTAPSFSDEIAGFATANRAYRYAKPFQFLNLGILAYTGGGSALAQMTLAPDAPAVKGSGKLGNAVWKSVYLSKQISLRNRLLVLNDWTNRRLFGRDITRL